MNKSDSISVFQLILLSMTFIGLKTHVMLISPLIKTAGRDAWITVLLTCLLTLIWVPLLVYVNKKTKGEHLFQWMKKHVNKSFTNVVIFLTIVYLTIMEIVTLRETITWINIIFLQRTPLIILVLLFGFTCCLLAATSIRTISIVNVFLLFFIVILGFFVSFTNFQFKDYSLLQPVLENGYFPVIKSIVFQGSGMVELLLLLFLQHKVPQPIRYKHLAVAAILLTGLTIGPLIGAITEFGPVEASKQRFPPYEEWGIASLGKFIEHIDFLSIYQWLSGTFIRISTFLFIMKELVSFQKGQKRFLLLILVVITVCTLAPITDFAFSNLLFFTIIPATFWLFVAFSLFLVVIVFLFSHKTRRDKSGIF